MIREMKGGEEGEGEELQYRPVGSRLIMMMMVGSGC